MPKVTEQHRAARREQILDAALHCVSREGFHKTSMADVIASADLSAGAVYSYFKSKNDIIKAIADQTIAGIDAALHEHLDTDDPVHIDVVLERTLERVLELAVTPDGGDVTRVALQVWAEACRDPEVHTIVHDRMLRIRSTWVEIVERAQQDGTLPADVDAGSMSQVLFAMMPGFILQRLILADVTPSSYVSGLRGLMVGQS